MNFDEYFQLLILFIFNYLSSGGIRIYFFFEIFQTRITYDGYFNVCNANRQIVYHQFL